MTTEFHLASVNIESVVLAIAPSVGNKNNIAAFFTLTAAPCMGGGGNSELDTIISLSEYNHERESSLATLRWPEPSAQVQTF